MWIHPGLLVQRQKGFYELNRRSNSVRAVIQNSLILGMVRVEIFTIRMRIRIELVILLEIGSTPYMNHKSLHTF